MKCYYPLNIPYAVLKDDAAFKNHTAPLPDSNWIVDVDYSVNFLTDNFTNFYRSLYPAESTYKDKGTVSIFRGNPGTNMGLHRDLGCVFSINYVIGSNNSEMIWYDYNEGYSHDNGEKIHWTTNKLRKYTSYKPYMVHEIDRTEIKGLYLVRVDIPHDIWNYDKENYRWCISIRTTGDQSTWDEVVTKFKPWIINTEQDCD